MVKKLFVLIIALSLFLLPVTSGYAKTSSDSPLASGPSGSFASEIFCTNIGSSATTMIQFNFYAHDSSTVVVTYTDTTPLAAGVSRNYFTTSISPSLPSPFMGSAEISADQPLECITNISLQDPNAGTTSVPARFATVEGFDNNSIGTTLYIPQLDRDLSGWNSYFAVQNIEQSDITVNVSYIDRYGTAYPSANQSVTVPANSNHVFYLLDNTNLPSNFIGGAKITSTGRMAANAVIYDSGADVSTSQFQAYPAFAHGSNKLYVPNFLRNYYDYQTGLTVQNIGTNPTTVTITFTFAGTTYTYNSASIGSGAVLSLYAPNITQLANVDLLSVPLRTGNAVVQAATGGIIVANINKDNRGTCPISDCGIINSNWVGQAVTFEAASDGTQTDTIVFPQITSHVGSGDWSGGYIYSNTTNTATTCTETFPTASAANRTGVTLGAFGTVSMFAPNVTNLPNPYNGSLIVNCGEPILGTFNISARSATYFGDSNGQANGFNK